MSESRVKESIKEIIMENALREHEKAKMVRFSAFISEEDKRRIDFIAKKLEQSASEFIRTLLWAGLKDAEEELGLVIAEEKDGKHSLTDYGKYLGYDKFHGKEN